MLADLNSRFTLNLDRVKNLLAIYENTKEAGRGRKQVPSLDLLRAATVFLHAALEDYLRGLVVWRFPSLDAGVLDEVPLSGVSPSGRPEKFLLGRLTAFRGRSVDDVINESVQAYADGLALNTSTDIVVLLRRVGLDETPVKSFLSALSSLMKRRHHIVHQADRNLKRGRGQQAARSIGAHTVRNWGESVEGFVDELQKQLSSR